MSKPIIKGYSPEWGSVVGGLRTGQFAAVGISDEIISQLLYVSITGGFTGTVNLERFVGGRWTIVDTYIAPETLLFENPKALRMRLNCISLAAGSVLYGIEDVYTPPTGTGSADPLSVGTVSTVAQGALPTVSIAGSPPKLNVGFPYVPAGGGGGGTVTVGDSATFDTRADALVASVDASVNWIKTEGFAEVGDFGAGTYKKLSGAPTLTTSKAYINTTNNMWFGLVPHGGREVYINQFGGKGNFVATPSAAVDNLGPTQDALSYIARTVTAVERFPYKVCLGFGRFWYSSSLEIHVHAHLHGMNLEEDYATEFWCPNTVTAIITGQNNTSGESTTGTNLGAGNSTTIEGILIQHHYATGAFDHAVFSPAHGIHCRTVTIIRNVNVARIAGHGILIHGNGGAGGALEGQPNGWHIRDSGCHSCGGHALCVYGADANAGSAIGWTTHTEVGGCGIYDTSPFVNYYAAIHIAGYGNRGVSYGGRRYVLIGNAPIENPGTIPNTTQPGTNPEVWFDVGADDGSRPDIWAPWSSGGPAYMHRLPIYDNGGTSVYMAPYIEISSAPAHILPGSVCFGGTIGLTPYSSSIKGDAGVGAMLSTQGLGFDRRFQQGAVGLQAEEYTRNGERAWLSFGGPHEPNGFGTNGGMQIVKFRRLSDGDVSWQLGYAGNDLIFTAPGGTRLFDITTKATTKHFGKIAPERYKFSLYDPVMQDPTDSNNGRVFGMRVAPPADAGGYARGERYYNSNLSPGGTEGWAVTTGGAYHNTVWSSGVGIDGNTVIKNSANRVYKLTTQGIGAATSTIEPVHTSGSVTDAQGNVWLWIADGPPVFKTFGTIGV